MVLRKKEYFFVKNHTFYSQESDKKTVTPARNFLYR